KTRRCLSTGRTGTLPLVLLEVAVVLDKASCRLNDSEFGSESISVTARRSSGWATKKGLRIDEGRSLRSWDVAGLVLATARGRIVDSGLRRQAYFAGPSKIAMAVCNLPDRHDE